MKIGVLGGTFNPIHNGHIKIASLAKEKLGFDKVLFIPNKIPPHKNETGISDQDKLNMIKEAIADFDGFELDTFELDNDGISYLYITLEYLINKYKNDEIYFIAGADNIATISKWKNPELIFKYAKIVFVKRPDFELDKNEINKLEAEYGGEIKVIDFDGIDISSSEIRENFEKCKPVGDMVPKSTLEYIHKYNIYPVNLKEKLKSMLKPDRYIHSLNVAKAASSLARHYNSDWEKAYYAGLLHDCAKNISIEKQIELIEKFNTYELMDEELDFPKVIHALCGPIIAKQEFGIDDVEILDAIRFHTLGNVKMTLLDKIIYIADLICEDRNYKGIEILREMAYNNIDMAIITSIENTINYLGEAAVQKDVIKLKDFLES